MEAVSPEKNVAVDERSVGSGSGTESPNHGATPEVSSKKKVPWYYYIWDFDPGRSKEERQFIQRLDISVLVILSLGYFIKNLDQTNISNAYVSGMKEDLRMNANQLNIIDVAWTSGYVVGQLPSQIILTKVRPSIWIPSCELVWTMLTFCIAAATTSKQVIAIRFFVGLVESIFYPAAHVSRVIVGYYEVLIDSDLVLSSSWDRGTSPVSWPSEPASSMPPVPLPRCSAAICKLRCTKV
jgi:MFS transporter, ACS family, pantothenate transporter